VGQTDILVPEESAGKQAIEPRKVLKIRLIVERHLPLKTRDGLSPRFVVRSCIATHSAVGIGLIDLAFIKCNEMTSDGISEQTRDRVPDLTILIVEFATENVVLWKSLNCSVFLN